MIGLKHGLVWFLRGARGASTGAWQASIGDGYVVFDKTTRRTWWNPYAIPCETLQ